MQHFDTHNIPPLMQRGDIKAIEKIFNYAADWDTRETAVIALRMMVWNELDYDKALMRDVIARTLTLCEAESGGGDYRSNCIKSCRDLLDDPRLATPLAREHTKKPAAPSDSGKATGSALPSLKLMWQCPECGAILQKKRALMGMKGRANDLHDSEVCNQCSNSIPQSSIYNDEFDFACEDDRLKSMVNDQGNFSFDNEIMRWRYKGQVVSLQSDGGESGLAQDEQFSSSTSVDIQEDEKAMSTESIIPSWYFAESQQKHARQVVFTLPPEGEVPPRVENLVAGGAFMQANWAATVLFMGGDSPETKGPFIFAKASGVIEAVQQQPVTVAVTFYRFRMGGVVQVFVAVDSPAVRSKAGYPYLAEHARWLDEDDDRKLIASLIKQDTLQVCFVAPGEKGPCTGYFGLSVALPAECREVLKKEWNGLLKYHNGVRTRDLKGCLDQYNRENPMEGTPILEQSRKTKAKITSSTNATLQSAAAVNKRWWQFWK